MKQIVQVPTVACVGRRKEEGMDRRLTLLRRRASRGAPMVEESAGIDHATEAGDSGCFLHYPSISGYLI